MDFNYTSTLNLKNLEEQIYAYRPNLKSSEEKENVGKKLRQQLIDSKAVVRLQRMDVEYERLMTSLKQRLMLLQDVLIPKHRKQMQACRKEKNTLELNLSSDSSDDEMLSTLVARKTVSEKQGKIESFPTLQADSSEMVGDEIVRPLALRRKPRERKLSYKSYTSSSTSNSRNYTKSHGKQEHTVSTSSVEIHHDDILMDEIGSTPTIHIKIPSLHRGNVHHIFLDSLKFARKAFDFRVREVKQQQQHTIISETKIKKSQKKRIKTLESGSILQQLTQQEQDDELSQLIQDVMTEACNDETLQATNALENMNNNLLDNYESHTNDPLLLFSQSSEELKLSQNSPMITNKNDSIVKKSRKYTKRSNEKNSDEPPKKRGRKPKKKNVPIGELVDVPQSQPPKKSNLAKYVEHFANDCGQFIPGSSTPAASSTMSQPLVSSTTHNFEIVDQQERQQQQPITYYIDGDWANGGPCQLVPTNGMSVDVKQVPPDDLNVPFQEIVNYIDNNSDIGNNDIARVLENGNSLPISIPLPITNTGLQNFIQNQVPKKSVLSTQNSTVPVINIQIPNLPHINTSSPPPPAHLHEEVLDLTVKSRHKINIISTEVLINNKTNNIMDPFILNNNGNCCLPLDLSMKNPENNCVTVDNQDDAFMRQLIETSDFNYTSGELKKDCNSSMLSYDDKKSFKAALDMPLLEFNDTDLTNLVKDSTTTLNKNNNNEQDNIADNCVLNDATNINDSNYISMAADNSSENNLYFSNHSTKEIFDKLLDIGPIGETTDNASNGNVFNGNDLNENEFYNIEIQNSTMFEVDYSTITEHQLPEKVTNKIKLNELTNSSVLEDDIIIASAKQTTLDECKANETTTSSPHVSENNLRSKQEDLNTSLSSDISLHLKFSDTEESNGLFSPVHDAKEDKNLGSMGTDKSNENKEKMSTFLTDLVKSKTNKTVTECEKTSVAKDSSESNSDVKLINTNENIVFSVAKITLSDDGNLYTDSDTASGKSNDDIVEYKANNNVKCSDATENQIISLSTNSKDVNCSDEEDLDKNITYIGNTLTHLIPYQGKNEVIKDSVIHQLNHQKENIDIEIVTMSISSDHKTIGDTEEKHSKIDVVINKNRYQDAIDLSSKESNRIKCLDNIKEEQIPELDTAKGLTLLDLESKLDDPLDFEEDFDDALSLATSCFDSPNDDRFLDSIIEETILDKSEKKSSSPNDKVKPFKIPKVKNSDSHSDHTDDVKVNEEPTLCNTTTTVSKTITNMEKITRTVKNDAAEAQSLFYTNIQINSSENEIIIPCLKGETFPYSLNVYNNLFGITCLPYLVDKCFDPINCNLSHQFNDPGIIFERLKNLSADIINRAYQLLYNHKKLFRNYFKVFCTYYTTHNDRSKLLNMVNDCERYPEYSHFIIDIYEGLVKCGLSRANACRQILKRHRDTSTLVLDALVAIILKSDWTMFSDYIEKYTQEEYNYNFRINVLEQMAPAVLNSKGTQFKQVFGKCVQMLHCEDTSLLLNSPILIQCVALLAQT